MSRHHLLSGLSALVLVATVGCSSTTTSGDTATTPPSSDTSVPDTTPGETTLPSSSTSSTLPAVDALLLRADGIGANDFGDEFAPVYDDMEVLLGFPASDLTDEYTEPDGVGHYNSADGEMQFIAPFSRTVCWTNSLCLVFAGGTTESMSFAGWRYDNDPAATLATESGATLGSTWAEVPGMTVLEGGCYTVGYGEVDSIHVVLLSTGLQFTEVDSSGNFINNTPAAADVTILSMETGELPIFLYGDC